VLKELLENSLDADARGITVTLDEGGAKRIQVEDDGAGIARDDLPLALARHATSKIRSLDDLEGVRSMGFRGEALASIASVSRVSITACTREAPHGAAIRAEGPHIGEVEPAARAPGTTVTVADLYFNTPARRKFLRSEATEFGHCDELFRRVALARPEIAFTLKHNGRASRHLRSQPLRERVAALLGGEFIDASLPVEVQAGTLHLFGYAGSPQARAEAQYFFVNGGACATGCWRTPHAKPMRRCCTASASPATCCSSRSIRAASTSTCIRRRPKCAFGTRAAFTSSCCMPCDARYRRAPPKRRSLMPRCHERRGFSPLSAWLNRRSRIRRS